MTQWIEQTATFQDGQPKTKAIKIPEMSKEVYFTTNAFAEVPDNVADLLAAASEDIRKVSTPSSPGEYYEEAPNNAQVTINLPDGFFDNLSADNFDVDSGLSLADVTGADPLTVTSLDAQSGTVDNLTSKSVNADSVNTEDATLNERTDHPTSDEVADGELLLYAKDGSLYAATED